MGLLFSCSDSDAEESKRVEYAQIAESKAPHVIIKDLYIASDGDYEAIARILNCTPSTLIRISAEKTYPTPKFEERLRSDYFFYITHNSSFDELRAKKDPKYNWTDTVLDFYDRNPGCFWTINIIFMLVLAFYALGSIFFFLGELLVYLIAWIVSLFLTPNPIVDNFVDLINPLLEHL